ncbi:hypothetical protein Pcinc_025413 [Petrolisthes cinctipes]|uniref:Uncharacterized protein n=1 Tax=Petrolisthes cinctipes TaxID=88211 RepID=A0AAE1KBN0_PETCI|nr:hypothetical protein Pcinc_025413 [Petrolisthes cinctipes]
MALRPLHPFNNILVQTVSRSCQVNSKLPSWDLVTGQGLGRVSRQSMEEKECGAVHKEGMEREGKEQGKHSRRIKGKGKGRRRRERRKRGNEESEEREGTRQAQQRNKGLGKGRRRRRGEERERGERERERKMR